MLLYYDNVFMMRKSCGEMALVGRTEFVTHVSPSSCALSDPWKTCTDKCKTGDPGFRDAFKKSESILAMPPTGPTHKVKLSHCYKRLFSYGELLRTMESIRKGDD